jgi:hypothetical protein
MTLLIHMKISTQVCYNAGENAVRRYGRIPPYKETRTFVDRVLRYWDEFSLNKQNKP